MKAPADPDGAFRLSTLPEDPVDVIVPTAPRPSLLIVRAFWSDGRFSSGLEFSAPCRRCCLHWLCGSSGQCRGWRAFHAIDSADGTSAALQIALTASVLGEDAMAPAPAVRITPSIWFTVTVPLAAAYCASPRPWRRSRRPIATSPGCECLRRSASSPRDGARSLDTLLNAPPFASLRGGLAAITLGRSKRMVAPLTIRAYTLIVR